MGITKGPQQGRTKGETIHREITSTELDATVSAICQLAAKHDGEAGADRDYRRALMRVGAEHDMARQRRGEAPSPTDMAALDAAVTTILGIAEQAQRAYGVPLAAAAREYAPHYMQNYLAPGRGTTVERDDDEHTCDTEGCDWREKVGMVGGKLVPMFVCRKCLKREPQPS